MLFYVKVKSSLILIYQVFKASYSLLFSLNKMSSISQIRYEFHPNYSQSLCSKPQFIFHRPITSLYLPAVEKHFTAYDIAMAFHTDNILIPSVITIEKGAEFNSVYIGIQQWHDTEAAYNFIMSLSNPAIETLYGNGEGGSWVVEVNVYSHKLVNTGSKKRSVTTFSPSYFAYEEEEEDEEQQQEPAPLQRHSAAWSTEDYEGCLEVLGEPLTFANEDMYFMCRDQRNAWVDEVLEKMESDERYRYEQPAIEGDDRDHFDDDFDHDFSHSFDDEDDEELRRKDFEQDANEWYSCMMEQKIQAKRTMNTRQFDAWQKSFDKNLTNEQFAFQLFLQTGLLPKY